MDEPALAYKNFEHLGKWVVTVVNSVDTHQILHGYQFKKLDKMGKIYNSDLSFVPMPLVSNFKDQSKLPKSFFKAVIVWIE